MTKPLSVDDLRKAIAPPTFADLAVLRVALHNIATRRPVSEKRGRTFEIQREEAHRALNKVKAQIARRDTDLTDTGGRANRAEYKLVEDTLKTIAERRPRDSKKASTFLLCRRDARKALAQLKG